MSGFRPRFFVPVLDPAAAAPKTGSLVTLDAEDSHHGLKVLRLRPGDECEVVVGAAVYAATVIDATGGGGVAPGLSVRLEEQLEGAAAGAVYRFPVVLVQALTRPSALDWSVEKSIEAGASLIVLVRTAGSPREAGGDWSGRLERWARIAREAAKQSKQPAVPAVELAGSFAAALERTGLLGVTPILLQPGAQQTLYEVTAAGTRVATGASGAEAGASEGSASRTGAGPGVALWIGPEGGWSDEERETLLRAGLVVARLGRGVLRTETAGPVAAAVARLALGDW